MPDGDLLLSFNKPVTLDGLPVDDGDIVRFTPTTLGHNTGGTFRLAFVGAQWGLETHSEDIDAISITPEGFLAVSTIGRLKVPGALPLTARDEDLSLVNSMPVPGFLTAAPLPYFDGSNIGLTKDSEDIGASWIDPLTGEIYLATRGTFRLTDGVLLGNQDDLWVCDPAGLWHQTACRPYTIWEGDDGFRNERIDGFAAGDRRPESTLNEARAAAEEVTEAEEDLTDEDDIDEEGGTSEEVNDPASRSYLPLIQR